MTTALQTLSRSALVKKVESAERARARDTRNAEELGNRVLDFAGSLTAGATAAAIGIAEERFKDGATPLSVGPVPLTLAVGGILGGVTLMGWNPGRQVSYAAAGCAGAYSVTRGRAWGAAWRAMAGKKKRRVSGHDVDGSPFDDSLSDHEAAILANLEGEL